MSVSPALTSDERTALAGISTLTRYLSPIPDTTIATSRVNQAVFSYPIASLTVDNTSAGWSDVQEGQTVYVGSTAGLHDRGIFRVRKAGNSTTLFLGEISGGDPGLVPQSLRTASFADNDYVTVLQRWDIFSVLPRINPVTAQIYEDFDKLPSSNNTTPPPLTYIYINGRRNHYFDFIETAAIAITATASVVKWPTSSGSTVSYAWTVPSAWTGVSGATSATLTATAPPGNYILKCVITDSIGGAFTRQSYINIHDRTNNPPLLISNMPRSDVRDRVGRRMSFDLYDNRLASIRDGAACAYFEVATWNSTDVPTATRQFVGWLQHVERTGAEGLRQAEIELISPAHLLGLLNSTSQVITRNASPTTWQQAVPSLMSASFMAWYMLQWRVGNLLRLFNFTVFSTDPAGQRLPKWQIDKGTIYQQIQLLATDRGNFGCNSEGEFFFLRLPQMIAYAARSSVVLRDQLDASLYNTVTISEEKVQHVSQVRGEAFSWNGSAALPTPYYSDAPVSPGQGGAPTKLLSQVLTDQNEVNQLTGDWYAKLNNPFPTITATILKNRDVIEPAELPFVQMTVPDYLSPDGIQFQRKTIPLSVNKKHNSDGTADIALTLEPETTGISGGTVPVPAGNSSLYTPPYTPPPIAIPAPGSLGDWSIPIPGAVPPTIPASGAPTVTPGVAAVRNNAAKVYRTYDLRPTAPTWDDVTPPIATGPPPGSWSRTYDFRTGNPHGWNVRAYDSLSSACSGGFLGLGCWGGSYDGTGFLFDHHNDGSRHWRTSGVYLDLITEGDTGTHISSITITWDVSASVATATFSDAGFVGYTSHDFSSPYTAVGVGPNSGFGPGEIFGTPPATANEDNVRRILIDGVIDRWGASDEAKLVEVTITGTGNPPADWVISQAILDQGTKFSRRAFVLMTNNTDSLLVTTDDLFVNVPDWTFQPTITGAFTQIRSTREVPGEIYLVGNSGGDVITIRSPDYGATFESSQTVDTLSFTPGFDVGRKGLADLCGGDARVAIAVSGGTYSTATGGSGLTATHPTSLCIPDLRLGSASLTNISSAPQYFFATADLVSGESFFKVTVSRIAMTPTVSGDKPVGVGPYGIAAWRGNKIMIIGDVVSGGTTRYLFRSASAGGSWQHVQKDGAVSIRARRFSTTGKEWLLALGLNGLEYSTDSGGTWVNKTSDITNYAEIYG